MRDDEVVLIGAVLEDAGYSLDEFAAACRVSVQWVERRVEEGLLGFAGRALPDADSAFRICSARAACMRWNATSTPSRARCTGGHVLEEMEALRMRLERAGFGRM